MSGKFLGFVRIYAERWLMAVQSQNIDEMYVGPVIPVHLGSVESPVSSPSSDVMTKHSKNNTASSIFSYAERKKLDYGTKGVRPLN
jgi:hypothetical protein